MSLSYNRIDMDDCSLPPIVETHAEVLASLNEKLADMGLFTPSNKEGN